MGKAGSKARGPLTLMLSGSSALSLDGDILQLGVCFRNEPLTNVL